MAGEIVRKVLEWVMESGFGDSFGAERKFPRLLRDVKVRVDLLHLDEELLFSGKWVSVFVAEHYFGCFDIGRSLDREFVCIKIKGFQISIMFPIGFYSRYNKAVLEAKIL